MRRTLPFPLLALAMSLLLAACTGPVAGPGAGPPLPAAAGAPQNQVPAPQAEPAQVSTPVDAPAPTPDELATLAASLKSQGPAPELHNQVWLNSEPLKLADLRGQVVIVEFWTYG